MKEIYYIISYTTDSYGKTIKGDVIMDFAETEERIESRLKVYKMLADMEGKKTSYYEAERGEGGYYQGAFFCVVLDERGSRDWYSVRKHNVLQ